MYQKNSFDAKTTYYQILSSKSKGMDDFDALTNSQKQDVWEYKYDRYVEENPSLGQNQLNIIAALRDVVSSADFSESSSNSANDSLELNVYENFSSETGDFLLYSLENEPGNTVVNGCFWCNEEISRTPCVPEIVDGQWTGDFTMEVTARVRRFWIGWRYVVYENVPCDPFED